MKILLHWPLYALLLAVAFSAAPAAIGHEKGENYVFLTPTDAGIEGRFEFRFDDLRDKLGVDIVSGPETTETLQKRTASQVHEYIRQRFSIGPNPAESYTIEFGEPSLFNEKGVFAQYPFRIAASPLPNTLFIRHEMCYEGDRLHRGVLVLEEGVWPAPEYKMQIAMVFSNSTREQSLDLSNPPQLMTPLQMIWQGVLHIWIGIDHILFLVALALPIVLINSNKSWAPATSFRSSLWNLLKVVSVFTIAHSVTLLLASLDIVSISSRLVESIIALSIILVGLNNIFRRDHNTSLLVILALGLFHGLGFASVMAELPFRVSEMGNLVLIILGFNVGVELGQLLILAVAFPLLFALRKAEFYGPIILTGGSAALVLVAGYWFVERALGI